MTPNELKNLTVGLGLEVAVETVLKAETVTACSDSASYFAFCDEVRKAYPNPAEVFIAGSGNWGFSLNPDKQMRAFGDHSDIDVAVVHEEMFHRTWEELRAYHRLYYYRIPKWQKDQLRRSGENIYSGFISPSWIPNDQNQLKYQHISTLNRLSSAHVGFKPVKMLFFKNKTEAIDYYKRGFRLLHAS